MGQWRWSLTDDKHKNIQESGQRPYLRDAMNDVATTVEYILNTEYSHNEKQIEQASQI